MNLAYARNLDTLDIGSGGLHSRGNYGATRPLALYAAWVSGISSAHSASILSATMAISRCGNDGVRARSSWVRSDRKCMSDRALQVAYMLENRPTGSVARATSLATPASSIAR